MSPQSHPPQHHPSAIYYYVQRADNISSNSLQNENKCVLLDLISLFQSSGISRSGEIPVTITADTAQAARMFIDRLPAGVKLPTASPDGEGGLTFTWQSVTGSTALVIDGFTFHLATAVGTPDVKFYDESVFDGEQIPKDVLRAVYL
jgi:hypothetical protein